MEKVKLIRGSEERAEEIRKTFKELGGKNLLSHTFSHDEFYYYVDPLGIIRFINYKEFESIDKSLVEICELPALQPKCEFKPFERVLVRDEGWQKWMPSLFGKYDENAKECPYYTMSGYNSQCVKYEGNEHLLGTADNPK